MAAKYILPIEQGATLRFSFTVLYETGELDSNGEPVTEAYDFTGCTARMQIRESPGAPILAEASTTDGGITLGTTDGRVSVYLTAAQTDQITVRRPRYDIEVTYPTGDVQRVLEGTVACSLAITRDES